MLVTVDIGNTNIAVAVYEDSRTLSVFRINTHPLLSAAEYRRIVSGYTTKLSGKIEGVVISSVAPSVTENFSKACKDLFGKEPVMVNTGTVYELGLKIKIAEPETIGADLICAIAAASELFAAPCIVIDMGTVTKFLAINKKGEFTGGGLFPGLRLCLETFSQGELIAESVKSINFTGKKEYANAIQNTTENCMKAGILYGTAEMIDGIVSRYEDELGGKCTVVSTGGHFDSVRPYCKTETCFVPDLLSQGMKIIYGKTAYK
jgi:type III pantothenate kinase